MLLIIGLDGATWDLATPWIEAGALPNLARLRAAGASGPLRSTIPAATLPGWTSFTTGVNPGKHGVFDFTRRVFGTYDVQFTNATYRKAPTIWSILGSAGARVAVLGVPGSYPPEPINGCMVSGFDTPVTVRADDSFVQPASYAALVADFGGFPFAEFQEFRVDRGWYRDARRRLLAGIERKTRLARALIVRETWDCFAIVFGESDTAAHHFWHLHDSASPRADAALAAELGNPLREVYAALDTAIGELLDCAGGGPWMVLSDHGFGGAGDRALYLNGLLSDLGFQRRRAASGATVSSFLKRTALTALPVGAQAPLFRIGDARLASRLESRARFAGIEWSHTRAFSEELNYFPSVWLNACGRDPAGTVDRCDYERVRDDVCGALESYADPESGRAIVRRAWRREEIYDGPWTSQAPDVVLELALDRGYSYTCLPSATQVGGAPLRRLAAAERSGGKLAGMSGSHRSDGMLLFGGPGVAQVELGEVGLADVGATVLQYCGAAVPDHFDGVGLLAGCGATAAAVASAPAQESPYSVAEEAEISARLAALGYVE